MVAASTNKYKLALRTVGALLLGVYTGLVAIVLLMVLPSFEIRRLPTLDPVPWQEFTLYAMCAAGAALAFARIFSADAKLRQRLTQQNLYLTTSFAAIYLVAAKRPRVAMFVERYGWLLGVFYLFLYCASCSLCLRLGVLQIAGDQVGSWVVEILKSIGLVLIACAIALQLKSVFAAFSAAAAADGESQTKNFTSIYKLRHPILFSWLIFMAGLPLVYAVWMPLVALPGAYVAIMGWINRRELSLRGEFGQKYSEFQQKTWCLIPGTAYGAAKQTVVDKWNADN